MKIIDLISRDRVTLKYLIDKALIDSLNRTHSSSAKLHNKPQEPDFVADLTLKWTQELHNILKTILNPYFSINLTSVYCHQKPLADFGKTPSPELGDILFVFKYTDIKGQITLNSLLLQAKMTSSNVSSVPKSELHQLGLYVDWPKFKYKRAGKLNGKAIDIHPKCITLGAKYLLIDPDTSILSGHPGLFGFGCAIPNKILVLSTEFTDEIIQLLTFNAGRSISTQSSITEDWSKMVWDLLDITKNKMTRRNNVGLKSFPRQVTSRLDGIYFMAIENDSSYYEDIHSKFGSGNDGGQISDDSFSSNDESGGVSTIFIELNENG